jgi:hypothetical protein
MMRNITIETIPHKKQNYSTVGDYGINLDGSKWVKISDMNNEDYEFLVAIHELIEQHLCQKRGISEESINAFDVAFEKNRPEGNEDEPGDDPRAPYRKEHLLATGIEKILAAELGVDWKNYDAAVFALPALERDPFAAQVMEGGKMKSIKGGDKGE